MGLGSLNKVHVDIKNKKTQKYALANETCKNKKGCQIINAHLRGYKEPDEFHLGRLFKVWRWPTHEANVKEHNKWY